MPLPSLDPRPPGWMVRFRSTSEIARVFGILAGTIGQIREPGWVDEDGRRRIVVWFESGGYCSGVPLDEVEAI